MNESDEMRETGLTLVQTYRTLKLAAVSDPALAAGASEQRDAYFAALLAFNEEVVKANPGSVSIAAVEVPGDRPELTFHDRSMIGALNGFIAGREAVIDHSDKAPGHLKAHIYHESPMAARYTKREADDKPHATAQNNLPIFRS